MVHQPDKRDPRTSDPLGVMGDQTNQDDDGSAPATAQLDPALPETLAYANQPGIEIETPGSLPLPPENSETAIAAAAGSVTPDCEKALRAMVDWVADEISKLIIADCDGAMSAGQNSALYEDLPDDDSTDLFPDTAIHDRAEEPRNLRHKPASYVADHSKQIKQ